MKTLSQPTWTGEERFIEYKLVCVCVSTPGLGTRKLTAFVEHELDCSFIFLSQEIREVGDLVVRAGPWKWNVG